MRYDLGRILGGAQPGFILKTKRPVIKIKLLRGRNNSQPDKTKALTIGDQRLALLYLF